nr:MAG TPA: hypothetical protein [Caudoviricetes sp.]
MRGDCFPYIGRAIPRIARGHGFSALLCLKRSRRQPDGLSAISALPPGAGAAGPT